MSDVQTQTMDLVAALNLTQEKLKQLTVNSTNLTATDRTKGIQRLYFEAHCLITEMALANPRITFEDAFSVVEAVSTHLSTHKGDPTLEAFYSWAVKITRQAIAFHALKRQYGRCIYAGAWSIIRNSTDLGYDDDTIQSLESDVLYWVLTDPRSPLVPGSGTGRVSTRLYGKASWLARAWRTSQLRKRAKFLTLDEARRAEENIFTSRKPERWPSDTDDHPDADLEDGTNREVDEALAA
jgi:hypothetical protein